MQYEKLMNWDVEDHPNIFVYQEDTNYHEGMFGEENKMSGNSSGVMSDGNY